MKFRAAASIALAAAVAAGLAGCNMISPQRTTMAYDASDGVGFSVGDFELRNVLILVDGDGDAIQNAGTLIATVVNHSGAGGAVSLKVGSASGTITVGPENGITKIGYDDGEQVLLNGVDLPVGGAIDVTFTGPGGASQTVSVPILDGTLAEYTTLVLVPGDPTATPGATEPGATTDELTPGETPGETLQP